MVSMVYGGLDVHKESITACLVCQDTGEVVSEQLVHDRGKLLRAVRRWSKLGELRLCYEASGAGFVLKRWLDAVGVHCDVIAPSLIPKAPGDRVKTDRRDARQLALLYRAGLLTPVRVPDQEEENARSLVRLREDLTKDCVRLKNRIGKYLRLLGHSYHGASFTLKHRRWIDDLPVEPVQRVIIQSYLAQLDHLLEQQREIDGRIEQLASSERYRVGVQRLMSLKGIGRYSAMVLLTEIGDARRFSTPVPLMSYFGLVPRESSSGERRRTGSITKAGNHHVRWILVEAAWHQMGKTGASVRLRKHWQSQPAAVVAIGKKAEKRLHHKFWTVAMRKDRKTAVTAVAREMAGFVWALLTLEVA